jgi:hypothetical protein
MDMSGQFSPESAFETIEETILPSLSLVLDSLIEAASLARAGVDADVFSAELRIIAAELETLTREVEAASGSDQSLAERELQAPESNAA